VSLPPQEPELSIVKQVLEQQKDPSTNLKNKMANTEKPATKAQEKKQGIVKTPKRNLKPETPKQIVQDIKKAGVNEKVAKAEEKLDEKATKKFGKENEDGKKEEPKKPIVKKTKNKKKITSAFVNGKNIPISTKQSIGICKFIKGKRIGDAIRDLEAVEKMRKAVPMKGEIPHRKGKMSSGRYPQVAAKNFVVLLKSLAGNSSEMDDPVIIEAKANFGSRPLGRFGRTKKKRSNIKIIVKEAKAIKK